tara:strand:- start:969 stop:1202 length:234 start_codon:yes stop_codon:yes gene_type:complete
MNKKIVVFIAASFTLMTFIPMSAHAISKKEGIQLCLKELNISKHSAEQCKENNWGTDACVALKKRLKPCVRLKVMGY